MKRHLLLAFLVSFCAVIVLECVGTERADHPGAAQMREASSCAAKWLDTLEKEHFDLGIENQFAGVRHGILLGEEFTQLTTTLGSVEAKRLSLNPEFAALAVRLLHNAGIDSTSTVGVAISGSFPGLAVSVLAALQTVKVKSVIVSSLGASSFGANRPSMTWVDMESILRQKAGLQYRSEIVTPGGEEDTGGGISIEGMEALEGSAHRNGMTLSHPRTLFEAIDVKTDFYRREDIDLLINIGGNHAMLGGCPHGMNLPPGFQPRLVSCNHHDRGVILRIAESGIPVIHFLRLNALASLFRITEQTSKSQVYEIHIRNKDFALVSLVVISGALVLPTLLRKRSRSLLFLESSTLNHYGKTHQGNRSV